MLEQSRIINCMNCEKPLAGNYCHNCGQSSKIERLTFKSILLDVFKTITNIENNMFSTVKGLIINPQLIVDNYLNGKRASYINPFKLFIILISIQYFVFKKVIPLLVENLNTNLSYIDNYPTLISFMSILLYGFLFSILFKKYNLGESLVVNSFYISVTIFIFLIATLFLWITGNQEIFLYVYIIPTVFFFFYFYGRLYKSSFILKYGKFLVPTAKLLIIFFICQSINSKLINLFT